MTIIETIDLARNLLNEPLSATRTFPDDSSSFWADTTLLSYFNRAQEDVANTIIQTFEHYFVTDTTISLVEDQDTYTLNTAAIKIVRVESISQNPLSPVEIRPMSFNEKDLLTLEEITDLTRVPRGRPERYGIVGASILFRPIPDSADASAIRLFFTKRLASFAASSVTSTSEIPSEHHELVAWKIVHKAQFQQEQDVTIAFNEIRTRTKTMKEQLERRQIQRSRHVRRVKFRR